MSYTRRNTTDGSTIMNKDLYDNLQDGIENKPFYYDSVADMKADLNLKEGMKAVTLGYYSPNDGGGAIYIIKAKTDEPNDGLFNLSISNDLIAEIIVDVSKGLNVLQFGCMCNANYFDENTGLWYSDFKGGQLSSDDSSIIQRLVDCNRKIFPKIIIPRDTCINKTITLRQGISIVGVGTHHYDFSFNTTNLVSNEPLDCLFRYETNLKGDFHHSVLSNFVIRGKNKIKVGISISGGGELSELKNLVLSECEVGIRITGIHASTVLSLVGCYNCSKAGIQIEGTGRIHLMDITGDNNYSLLNFVNCYLGLNCLLDGLKSEGNLYPILMEHLYLGSYDFRNCHFNVRVNENTRWETSSAITLRDVDNPTVDWSMNDSNLPSIITDFLTCLDNISLFKYKDKIIVPSGNHSKRFELLSNHSNDYVYNGDQDIISFQDKTFKQYSKRLPISTPVFIKETTYTDDLCSHYLIDGSKNTLTTLQLGGNGSVDGFIIKIKRIDSDSSNKVYVGFISSSYSLEGGEVVGTYKGGRIELLPKQVVELIHFKGVWYNLKNS